MFAPRDFVNKWRDLVNKFVYRHMEKATTTLQHCSAMFLYRYGIATWNGTIYHCCMFTYVIALFSLWMFLLPAGGGRPNLLQNMGVRGVGGNGPRGNFPNDRDAVSL